MGQTFVGAALGPGFGDAFGIIVSVVFALLLFSALNTSLVALITLQFLLARDREIPKVFQRLNKWGVPSLAMLMATVVPMLLVLLVKDISGLAELYAVGVVGAIATNLGATATDRTRPIRPWERAFMFVTFLLMAAIELSLLVDKPNARYFVITVLLIGLILRGLVQERRMKKEAAPALSPPQLGVDVARPISEASAPSGDEAQMAARSGSQRNFRRSETESREHHAAVLLCGESLGCRDHCRRCRDTRCIARHSRRATTQRADESASRQRHPRSIQLVAGRNRSARLRVKVHQHFDFCCLREHVERRDRLDNEFLVQLFQVARQCRRIARHVNQCFRREIAYRLANSFGESRCRWIDDDCGRGH